jgi:hypothetical protein
VLEGSRRRGARASRSPRRSDCRAPRIR